MELTVLQVTDSHLFPAPDATLLGVCTHDSLRAVLDQALGEMTPDAMIASGDLAQVGEASTYERFLGMIESRFKGPLLCVPGNHDLAEPFQRILPTSALSARGWDIIGIDTHVDDRVGGHVSDKELQRLDAALKASTNNVLVVGHHGPVEINAPWLDAHRVDNAEELLKILNEHDCVRGYLFGHVHQKFDSIVDGVSFFATPSTCFQFGPGTEKFTIDSVQPGYRWLTLNDDGTIDTRVTRLGEFDLTLDLTKTKY